MSNQQHEDGFPGLQEPFVPKTINLYLILDVSPSMISRWTQTLSGLNEYIDSLRKDQADNSQPYKVTMVTFSAHVNKIYDGVELDTLPKFTEKNLSPHGYGTALYDAVGLTVKDINTTDPVLCVIITDGEENSSRSWNEDKVGVLMDERQKLGNYTYAYLGVAREAWGNAMKMGSSVAQSFSNITAEDYTKGATYTRLGTLTANYSSMMRSNSVRGLSMNVSNFYDESQTAQAPEDAAEATLTVTTTTTENK